MIDECDDSFWCVSNLYYFNKQFVKAIKSAVEKEKCRKQKRRKKNDNTFMTCTRAKPVEDSRLEFAINKVLW